MDFRAQKSDSTRYAALPLYSAQEPRLAERRRWRRQTSSSNIDHTADSMFDADEPPDRGLEARGLGLTDVNASSARYQPLPNPPAPSFTASDGTFSSRMQSNYTSPPLLQGQQSSPLRNETTHLIDAPTQSQNSSLSHLGPPTPNFFTSQSELLYGSKKVDTACPSDGDVLTSPWSWHSVPILLLALYASVFSGIFLTIAIMKPRWGERIGTHGSLTFANASLMSAIFAKTIELSFVTVLVTLLGQVLTRRAFANTNPKSGISIAEMNMRTWIMQPGNLIVNWKEFRYANSIIGALVLVTALSATWYTTASEALVSPKLKFGPVADRMLTGRVSTVYANAIYLGQTCQRPIQLADDDASASTCLQITYAGASFNHFSHYLRNWENAIGSGNESLGGTSYAIRPPPVAVMYDNTTIFGQWITPSAENITSDSRRHGRLVENVTMAMPHAGIFNAVREPRNRILQPDDLQGAGEYRVQASVPAPAMNILCVGLTSEEMAPMIVNVTDPTNYVPNRTAVDDIFGWDPDAEVPQTPWFPKLPIQYNTIVHIPPAWGPPAVSLLATPAEGASTSDHVLCTIRSTQYRDCTTWYNVAQSGGLLKVHCDDDPDNTIPYQSSQQDAPIGVWEANWKDIGGEWIRSLALNNGVSDANASSARLLTQFIPDWSENTETVLPSNRPTIAESLAVLAGGTALLSSLNAPFDHFWNYTDTILEEPVYQTFRARYSYKDYASGGTQNWQGIFYVILAVVFLFNLATLCYLSWKFIRQGYVTDYTEPQNLFALAINSPSSTVLAGACGAGPTGKVMSKKWNVDMTRTDTDVDGFSYESQAIGSRHPHFFIRCREEELSPMIYQSHPVTPDSRGPKLRRTRPPTMNDAVYGAESPLIEQYQRLASSR